MQHIVCKSDFSTISQYLLQSENPYPMHVFSYVDATTGGVYQSRMAIMGQDQTRHAYEFKFRISSLEHCDFKRRSLDFDTEMQDFLQRLANQFKEIKLWYSGGLDSHFLLRNFVNHDMHLDEIFVVRKQPFDTHPFSEITAEESYTAIPYLQNVQSYLQRHNVRVTYLTLGKAEFEQHFQNPDWINHINEGEVRTPTFISHVIKRFGVDTAKSICHLNGCETPFFFYDQGWKFYFIDKQIIPETSDYIYKPTLHDSLFLECYVNAIVDCLELYSDYKTRFSNNPSLYRSKWFAQQLPQMRQTNAEIWIQYPKFCSTVSDGTDIMTCVNRISFKNYLDLDQPRSSTPNGSRIIATLLTGKS